MITVEYIDHMGDDDSIVTAARVSFAKRAEQFSAEQNLNLLEYLAKHKHEIPFAHTAITLRVKAPISIRTQCFKSKIGFVENEISRRYVTTPCEFFEPHWRLKPSGSIKQGSGDSAPEEVAEKATSELKKAYETCNAVYETLLSQGVAPEQARFALPQGMMTEWIWTGSLLAFARFYKLRSSPHAQQEVKEVAQQVSKILAQYFPNAWPLLIHPD